MASMTAPSRRFFHLFYEHTITACRHERGKVKASRHFHALYIPSREALHTFPPQAPPPEGLAQQGQRSALHNAAFRSSDANSLEVPLDSPSTDGEAPNSQVPPDPPKQDEPLTERMRTVMRRVPHPVVVITSGPASPAESLEGPDDTSQSMTVSSFNTVCLRPKPIVSFNTKVPSRTFDQIIERGGLFFVTFLGSGGKAAALAHEFAGRSGSHVATERYLATLNEQPDELNRWMHAIVRSGDGTWDGTLARARCQLLPEMTVKIGDHRIVVAEVEDVWYGGRLNDETRSPYNMLYANGKYENLFSHKVNPLKLDFSVTGEETRRRRRESPCLRTT